MYGEKIKAKRKELNLSQEDLANKLFVTRQAISKWENDKASPTMTNLREIFWYFWRWHGIFYWSSRKNWNRYKNSWV